MSLGSNTWLGGNSSTDLRLSPGGVLTMNAFADSVPVNDNFRLLVSKPYGSDFSKEYMSRLTQILDFQDTLNVALEPYPVDESISAVGPGSQLRMVKRAMQACSDLGHQRQVFIVNMGGFDTHSNQVETHNKLLQNLDEALTTFYASLEASGLADKVVTFTMSDFGRTIRNNSKSGTDHGWGSNQLVMGGAVVGGKAHGSYPQFVQDGANASGNKFIPGQSHEQMAATLCKWFGLDDTGVDTVFPSLRPSNANPFPGRYLGFLKGMNTTAQLTPVSVSADSGKEQRKRPAEYAVDGDPGTVWQAKGTGIFYTIELDNFYQMSEIKLALPKSDERQYSLTLQYSADGTNYLDIMDVVSSGTTSARESYLLNGVSAKYLRIVCNGHTQVATGEANLWNEIQDIEVFGNLSGQ